MSEWWPWTLLAALLLLAPAVALYRRVEKKPGWRFVLLTLRGGALILLALAFAGLDCADEAPSDGERLALVIDDSASMTLRNAAGTPRSSRAAELAAAFVEANPGLEIVEFTTGEFAPEAAAALELLGRRRPDLAGVLLIGDGADGGGRGRAFGLPINVLAVEEPGLGDYEVGRPRAPLLVVARREAVVLVDVTSRGERLPPTTLEAVARRLGSDQSIELGRREVSPEGGGFEFRFSPSRAGWWLLELTSAEVEGEAATLNNTRRLLLRAVEDDQGALILSAGPHPEAAFLTRSLSSLPGVQARALHRRDDGRFYSPEGRRETPDLQSPAALFFIDLVPEGSLAAELGRRNASGRGTAFIWGRPGLTVPATAGIWSLLPFPPQGTLRLVEGQSRPESAHHNLFTRALAPGVPALLTYAEGLEVGPATLLTMANPAGRPVPGALATLSGTPRLLLLGAGWWRWHLARQVNAEDTLYDELVAELYSLLSTPPVDDGLRLTLERRYLTAGESLIVEVRTPRGVSGPPKGVLVDMEGGEIGELLFSATDTGRWRGIAATPDEPGCYLLQVQAGDAPHRETAEEPIIVDPPLDQLRRLEPDLEALRSLAEAGGGRYLEEPTGEPILSPPARTQRPGSPWRSSPWFIGLVVVLLATDWLLRRKRNLG